VKGPPAKEDICSINIEQGRGIVIFRKTRERRMKLKEIYRLAIEKGIENDPRAKTEIRKELALRAKEFRLLKGADRKAYDKEKLTNPYSDTRILCGDPEAEVATVMVGIDMEAPEVLAADRLNEKGASIDLVMAHHPEGGAWSALFEVMAMQAAILAKFGIEREVADQLMKDRIDEVRRSLSPANHYRSVDVARLVGMNYMCVHTPADNHVTTYLQRLFDRTKPRRLTDVVSMLKAMPEYADGLKKGAGPKILIGEAKKAAGRVFVDMTGGTEGSKKVFARLSQAGVRTIVAMHLGEEHYKNARDEHINVVIAGHIASDNLGMNLLLDHLEKRSRMKIIPCSGFLRIRR
jgi:putative NIF3 family GTP cyclohydrolase 1 type 2